MGPTLLVAAARSAHTVRVRRNAFASLLLCLATAAAAQVRLIAPEALSPIGAPALLLGGPAAPVPALTSALSMQARALSLMTAPQAADYLAAAAASPVPVERAAAKLSIAAIAEPRGPLAAAVPAAKTAPAGAAAELAPIVASAKADPALSAWFDGSTPALGLDALTISRRGWTKGGERIARLGQGDYGFVDAHPDADGVVLKTVAPSDMVDFFGNASHQQIADNEESVSRKLAEADAGPAYLGRGKRQGLQVSARERILDGGTLEDLARARKIGPEEAKLVEELMGRLAAAGLKPQDLRPSNIMIGRTALDPRRRAFVVDGGNFGEYPEGLDLAARTEHMMDMPVVLFARMDSHMGWIEKTTTVRITLEKAVERASRTTRWLRFKGFWKDFARAVVPY